MALATRPPVTTTGGDEESRHALSLALNAAGRSVAAAGDGEARSARRREGRSASELGMGIAAERLNFAHCSAKSRRLGSFEEPSRPTAFPPA